MTFFPAFQQILKAVLKRELSVQSGGECGFAAAWGDVVLWSQKSFFKEICQYRCFKM